MAMRKRTPENTMEVVKKFADYQRVPTVPPAYDFEADDFAQERWGEYTSARPPDKWLPSDLVHVAELVKIDVEIRAKQQLLEDEGDLITNRFGNLLPHPYVRIVAQLFSRRTALTKIINQSAPDTKQLIKKAALEAQGVKEAKSDAAEDDLLAKFEDD